MDHYKTLGVERNASPDEIKQAYRKLASIHHPDKGGDTSKFQEIQSAYETLSDPQKKNEYDMPRGGFGTPNFGGNPFGFSAAGFNFSAGPVNIDDIFAQMFNPHRHNHYPTYKTTVNVTLEQVYNGHEQILHFNTNMGNHSIKVDIPKGIESGTQIKYENLVPNTILIIEYRVYDHPKYKRNGLNLESEIEVSVLDLIVGSKVAFTTISGRTFEVMIKPYTQSNTILRLNGQGLSNQFSTGDQLLLIKPVIPANIDDRIIEAILNYK
jgi:DnaJ-class molecular chaperone